jgi:hypothetical protein
MSPKNLLKYKNCVSSLKEFSSENPDDRFLRVIGETESGIVPDNDVQKVKKINFTNLCYFLPTFIFYELFFFFLRNVYIFFYQLFLYPSKKSKNKK